MSVCPFDCNFRHGGECSGSMCMKPIDTEDEGIEYSVDDLDPQSASPHLIVIDQIEGNKKPTEVGHSRSVASTTFQIQQADSSIKP
jgi:hypothetical protein